MSERQKRIEVQTLERNVLEEVGPGPERNMKNIMKLTMIGAMVTFGAARLSAQSTNTNTVTFVTNVVQTITISLTGFEQSGGSNSMNVTPVHFATKDILADLSILAGTTFSSKAKLTAVTPVGGGSTSFVVVDGSSSNDVSSFFSATTVGTAVERAKTNAKGKATGTMYSIESFTYGGTADTNGTPASPITLTGLQGFTTTSLSSGAFNSSVNGPGILSGNPIVLHGTINGGPGKFEEVSQ
jgi:hypothetical protein